MITLIPIGKSTCNMENRGGSERKIPNNRLRLQAILFFRCRLLSREYKGRTPVQKYASLIQIMELIEFEEAIEKALNKIPKKFKEILEREEIQILAREEVPDALQEQYRDGLLFGIFTGIPFNRRSMFSIQMEPTRIELYKGSFEKAFRDRNEMERQIVKTVIHEIGHYFGFSERELRRLHY
jgi:predicted Zn-dependent protease with MMP-like domain